MKSVLLESENPINASRLEQLRQNAGSGPVLVLTHDNPDPDSLASGMAFRELLQASWGIESHLIYSGMIARAENRAMLELLTPVWEFQDQLPGLDRYSGIALVDTQPGAGNNRLPGERVPDIVIDHHHPLQEMLASVPYNDVRPEVGSTSTLLYQYLQAAGIIPDSTLATALFYGLHTDTLGLARGSIVADEVAYFNLLGLQDREKLVQVEQAGVQREYFLAFSRCLQAARLYGRAVVAYLGEMHRPDLTAEMADVLIRLDTARAALCLGTHDRRLYLSLRTKLMWKDAGILAQTLVAGLGKAGGHGAIAGGQVLVDGDDAGVQAQEILRRFLNLMEESGQGEPLLNDESSV
jgi:nanoRNase/pAp phosphatase (c-di-AMP/oligoRNAs hydrolase)